MAAQEAAKAQKHLQGKKNNIFLQISNTSFNTGAFFSVFFFGYLFSKIKFKTSFSGTKLLPN
jgi:hypothetical protein